MKYKTSLTATTLKSNENWIGIGNEQYTVNDDEFNFSLKILEFLLTEKDDDEILNGLDRVMILISRFLKKRPLSSLVVVAIVTPLKSMSCLIPRILTVVDVVVD